MAIQSDLAGIDEDDIYQNLHESSELQDRLVDVQAHLNFPSPRPHERQDFVREASNQQQQDDRNRPSRSEPDVANPHVDAVPIEYPLANLQVIYQPGNHGVEPSLAQPNGQPFFPGEGPPHTGLTCTIDAQNQEGATVGGVEGLHPDSMDLTYEMGIQENHETQFPGNADVQAVEQGTGWHQGQQGQSVAPTGRRKKRKLRRKRPLEPIPTESAFKDHDTLMTLQNREAFGDYHQDHDAAHDLAELGIPIALRSVEQQEPCQVTRPDTCGIQLQSEMEAAAADEARYYDEYHGSRDDFVEIQRIQQNNQEAAPVTNYQYLPRLQTRDGPPEIAQDYPEDVRPDPCPSSDIFGDAAQEFENRIYRKQQAKSARHQAARNAWQNDIRQARQAKKTLQDRLGALQQEKDELATAIAKQKAKIAGFEAMASKLKTFIGGLANDVDALKRDASIHRQNCEDLGEETQENKAVLNGLLQQLSKEAEKSSQLKNEAIKACHSAKSELSLMAMRANGLEEQLKEKVLLLAEEKTLREQIQSQLSSEANSGDAMLRLLQSSESSVLDKLSELADTVIEANSGKAISEQLGKTLAAVQGLSSQQTATVNDIVSVKGIVAQLSENLKEYTDSLKDPTNRESSLKTYIGDVLNTLKSDLCQQEKLAVQDATNREAVSNLQKIIEGVNARMADCKSKLSITQASEAQLKEHNITLQANIATLRSQILPGEKDFAQLAQLKAELSLKATVLETTKSELDSKASDLHKLAFTNGELTSQLNALNMQLAEASNAKSFATERTRLEEKHRREIESTKSEATAVITKISALQLSEAANALKKMTAEHAKASEKLAAVEKELVASKKQLDEVHCKHASEIVSMQKKIDSVETIAADWRREADSRESIVMTVHQALEEANSLKAQLSAEQEAVRKAVQEKDSLVEQIRQLRHECEEDEERTNEELKQCRANSKELGQRLMAELHAAEDRCIAITKEVQASAQELITAEKAKYDKQVEALHKSLQDSQFDLQTRIKADEEFSESLQKSWQAEERKNQAERTDLNGKILQAEMQRDKAVVDNERLREDLAKVHSFMTSRAATNPPEDPTRLAEVSSASDPRLQNRCPRPEDGNSSMALSQAIEAHKTTSRSAPTTLPHVKCGINVLSTSAPTRGSIVEEPQQESSHASNALCRESEQSSREGKPQSKKSRGSVVEESQYPRISASSDPLDEDSNDLFEQLRQSKPASGTVIEESRQHPYLISSQLRGNGRQGEGENHESSHYNNDSLDPQVLVQSTAHAGQHATPSHHHDGFRGPIIEEPQRYAVPPSQEQKQLHQGDRLHHQSSYSSLQFDMQSGASLDVDTETQLVPETQFEAGNQIEMPSFANFNAASTVRKGREHEVVHGAFDNPPLRTGAPHHIQKSMPPSNTSTRMVPASSSSLSSIPSQHHYSSSPSAAATRDFLTAAPRYKTPEVRSLGCKPQATQSIISGSSPGFVEQMANARTRTTYHSGGSSKKTGTDHHPNHKEPRAAAPKRKAQSQVVQGYEQEREKKSVNRSSRGFELSEGHTLSQMVASQNRDLQAPSSSHDTPHASSQSARMQTLAGTSSTSYTRQTRNTTRKLSKNDEMSARFARELNAAR